MTVIIIVFICLTWSLKEMLKDLGKSYRWMETYVMWHWHVGIGESRHIGTISLQMKRKVQSDLELMSFGELDPRTSLNPLSPDFIPISVARPPFAFDADDEIKRLAEENKNLRIDAAKNSDELRITQDLLKSTRSQNDLLRAKLLQNDLTKYRDILRMKQENNLDVITLLTESPELENIPQIQLALSSLNEYTARLLLAEEELDDEYATLVREAEENKTIQELQFDMSSVEAPNLDHSTLNLLQSLVIQNNSSSRPAVSPFSFPPAPISRSSAWPRLSSLSSRTGDGRSNDVAKAVPFKPLPRYTTLSMLLGRKVSGPYNSSGTGSFSPDSASPARSLVPCSEVAMSESIGSNPTSAFNAGASGTLYLTSAGATSADQDMDGAIGTPASCGKKYDKLSGLKLIGLKLTGVSIQHILNRVATFIDEGNENSNCCICFEGMEIEDSVYLKPCRHRFHKVCINQWIDTPGGVGTTCPMCRNYTVKEDEFPELGAVGKF